MEFMLTCHPKYYYDLNILLNISLKRPQQCKQIKDLVKFKAQFKLIINAKKERKIVFLLSFFKIVL